jgi:hypothetical protein
MWSAVRNLESVRILLAYGADNLVGRLRAELVQIVHGSRVGRGGDSDRGVDLVVRCRVRLQRHADFCESLQHLVGERFGATFLF